MPELRATVRATVVKTENYNSNMKTKTPNRRRIHAIPVAIAI